MALQELAFLPASRGTLQYLRRKLDLVKRGKNVLQMRRDQLAKELLAIMDELKKRPEAEKQFIEAARTAALMRMSRGEYEFRSMSSLVKPPKITHVLVSYQGVPVPQARVQEEPDWSKLLDPDYRRVVETLWNAVKTMIDVANKEVAVEKISDQLLYINRVVNSLEKNVIPQLESALRRVEERVVDEELEDFVRVKLLGGR
ncbi:V-type ATP synthase subunit D [Thermofilum pendens]|uniref:V-type ATPase, D subunit n=1 Tax=Thermofilum pendens (strain DSM 2475 / Hrk 5) TaxID=368408 RepID=A1RX19_THEPD|nr:V-type ATP synthase subunit D [Thermofilum pendens]ABL77749.1 V-type ATPase, D subunit [Thermofilum pendens Hrk 5]